MLLDTKHAPATGTTRVVWPARAFWGALVVVCAVTVYIGLPPVVNFGHDVFFFLDNAYRVLQGQVPHRDFESAWGPIIYLIDAAGLWLAGLRPDGLGYANALFGSLVAIWAWASARRRLSELAACAIGLYTLLLIVGPYSLGFGPLAFSPAMSYNRYGFALLGIVMVECSSAAGSGWSSGLACGLLAFLKVTYAAAAAPLMLITGGVSLWKRKRLLAIAVGAMLVALAALAYLRFDIAAMLSDYAMAASGRSRSWKPGEILRLGFGQIAESVPLILLALAARVGRVRWVGIAAVTLLLGGFLLSTNHQPATLPLNGFVAVLLADAYFRQSKRDVPEKAVIGFLTGLCLAPVVLGSIVSLGAATAAKLSGPPRDLPRLQSARAASMVFPESPFDTETGGPRYVQTLNDGMSLLRQHTAGGEGVLTVDMMNPFNYLLDRPSPTGGFAAGAYNYVFSDAAHPSGARWAGGARWVMVRKYSRDVKDFPVENYHVEGIRRIYQPFLNEHFVLIAETAHWSLWRRR